MLPLFFVFAVLILQAGVTYWLWREPIYLRAEKIAQTKLIWALPLLGAAMVAAMLFEETKDQMKDRKR